MKKTIKVISVVGARPNFIKILPLCREFERRRGMFKHCLVHTGQHYDNEMDQVFFKELCLPRANVYLGVGSGSHAEQTARVMLGFEKVCLSYCPDWVVVVGDVNSTLAAALVAVKLGIRVAHVEAGLRSFDHTMPEEINRLLTDRVSDLLFIPSLDANQNLLREGIKQKKIKFVGNIMIDTLEMHLEEILKNKFYLKNNLKQKKFGYVTLHRPCNVDSKEQLKKIVNVLIDISDIMPLIFPVHPRTKIRLHDFLLLDKLKKTKGMHLTNPLGYFDSICLAKNAQFVLTDSGGLQEETTYLKTACLTLRPSTERPITISQGTNKLTRVELLKQDVKKLILNTRITSKVPALWDGKTARRIVDILARS